MNPLKQCILSAYYAATLPARRRAAADRADREAEPIHVLFYHRVADSYPNGWTMPRATFAAQIRWLQANFDLVDLEEAQRRIASGRNRRPTACITFDDGYAENVDFAIPLLLRENISFCYFVSTNHVLRGQPFPHDLEAGRPLPPNTVRQLQELVAAGVEVGAHTRSHVHLDASMPHEHLVDEIVECKHELEATFNCEIRYFSFPYGQVTDLSTEAFQIAYRAGYRGVCSAYGGYNFPGDDSYHLERIHADVEFVRFKNWLTVDPRKFRNPVRFAPGTFRGEFDGQVPLQPAAVSSR